MRNKKQGNQDRDDLPRQQNQGRSEDEQIDDEGIRRSEEEADEFLDDGERFHNPNVDKSRGMKERERDNIE